MGLLRFWWAQLVVFAAIGVGVVFTAESFIPSGVWQEIVKHIGVGFIVAVIVAALFHFREVEEHLSKFASIVMVEGEYLGQLNTESLFKLRRKITGVVLEKVVTNRDHYDFRRLDQALEAVLFRDLAEPTGGEYRTDYQETVEIRFHTGAELAARFGRTLPPGCDERLYAEIVTVCKYRIVSPRKEPTRHDLDCFGMLTRVPFLTDLQQAQWFVGTCSDDRKPIELEIDASKPDRLSYKGKATLSFSKDGLSHVSTRFLEVETADEAPFIFKQMTMTTDSPQLTLASNVPVSLFRVHQMGLGHGGERGGETDGVVNFTYIGWMMKNHGYMLSWVPSEIRAALSARVSVRPSPPQSGITVA